MKIPKKQTLLATLACGLALASTLATAQTAVNEVEPNNPIMMAQPVQFDSTGTIIVNGWLGDPNDPSVTDVADYYVFHANAGDVLTIDIDNGWGDAASADLKLALYNVSLGYHIERENDDSAPPVDPGSLSVTDPRIDLFDVPTTGDYVVAVMGWEVTPLEGGGTSGSSAERGDYTLIISGATPATTTSTTTAPADPTPTPAPAEPAPTVITTVDGLQQINIEIKPGNHQRARYNPYSRGQIPVALLWSDRFDPSKVVQSSLRFGATGAEASLVKCEKHGRDVNRDGHLDLVCHFDSKQANFQKGDLEGTVSGSTTDGIGFEGRGILKVVHEKRDHNREHRGRFDRR